MTLVLSAVAPHFSKTSQLRGGTTSLDNPLQRFVFLTWILVLIPYVQPEPLLFQELLLSLTLPPGSAGQSLSPVL